MPVQVPESHVDLLARPIFAGVATLQRDGAPQVFPMWFAWNEVRAVVLLTHTRNRRTFSLIQRDPRVAIVFIDPDNPYRYLQLRGLVDSIEDDPTGEFYQSLHMRYNRGARKVVDDADVRVILTVQPVTWTSR